MKIIEKDNNNMFKMRMKEEYDEDEEEEDEGEEEYDEDEDEEDEGEEEQEPVGGTYDELLEIKNSYPNPEDYNVHHLISRAALRELSSQVEPNTYNEFLTEDEFQGWAPSILMTEEDHKRTLSYVNDRTWRSKREAALDYIEYQTEEVLDGNIMEVLREECDYIRTAFNGKYDRAIDQMYERFQNLITRNEGTQTLYIRNPDDPQHYAIYHYN